MIGCAQAAQLAEAQALIKGEELGSDHAGMAEARWREVLDGPIQRPCRLGRTGDHRQQQVATAALELRRGEHHGWTALVALPVGEWERNPDDGETGVDHLQIRECFLVEGAVPFLQARLQALQEGPI